MRSREADDHRDGDAGREQHAEELAEDRVLQRRRQVTDGRGEDESQEEEAGYRWHDVWRSDAGKGKDGQWFMAGFLRR